MNTTTTAQYAFYHIEWWDTRTGQEVLFTALEAMGATDGCHVYNHEALACEGDTYGEMDIFFSVPVASFDAYSDGVDAIRWAGLRVKTAMFLEGDKATATGTLDDVWRKWDEV